MSNTVTTKEVGAWAVKMGERGVFNINTARFKAGALDELSSILGEDEPNDAQWLLDNIEQIGKRWGVRNNSNPGTISTYTSRARAVLTDYFAYQSDPAAFKVKSRGDSGLKRAAENGAKPKPKRVSAAVAAAPAPVVPVTTTVSTSRNYPLGNGRSFSFDLPQDGITVRELRKVAWHLVSLASDFDESQSPMAQLMALPQNS